jgi:hypothetical protein
MIYNYGYLLHEAERTRNPAEQRQADALVGQFAAAVARRADSVTRLWMSLAASARARGHTAIPARLPGPQCAPTDSRG